MSKTGTIHETSTQVLQRLKDDGVFNHDQIYFVAHSMGGLIGKSIVAELNRANPLEMNYLDRVRALIFLSTPAKGAEIAGLASWISLNPQLRDMKTADLNTFLQRLEDQWETLLRDRDALQIMFPKSYCAYETKATKGTIIVSRVYASSRCDMNPHPFNLDHNEISAPPSNNDELYLWVKKRIIESSSGKQISRMEKMFETGLLNQSIQVSSLRKLLNQVEGKSR